MRKLIFAINLTLDGCCDHTKGTGDAGVHAYHTQLLRESDTMVYGRKTYELMVPFWPDIAKNHSGPTKDMNDFADAFVAIDKLIVFSKSLQEAPGKNTKIIRNNLREEILKLKGESGKDILTGGVDIPSQLIRLGLVDEYRIVIQPKIVGDGRRLLEGLSIDETLKLVESKTLGAGNVVLRYVKS